MKIELLIYCGSDRAYAAETECERELAGMKKHYPTMMLDGKISGKLAEERQSAMEDAVAILRLVHSQIQLHERMMPRSLTDE